MLNSTQVLYFTLQAYFDTGPLRYFYFLVVLSLQVFILCANLLLIVVICVNRSLHEPMYIFLCSLFVNELYGSTGLFPFLLVQILSDIHTVSASLCYLQTYFVCCFGGVEYLSLAVMSYDRYLAICCPLEYHRRMSRSKVASLIAVSWICPFLVCLVLLCLTSSLRLCGNIIHRVYCVNYSVVKLSCSEAHVVNTYGLISTFGSVVVVLVLILFSYLKILRVCYCGSKQTRQRAVSTCSPHLAALLNYTFGVSFEMIQSRFNMSRVPSTLRVFLSLYWLVCSPLLNPVMYGLKLSKIYVTCKSLISNVS